MINTNKWLYWTAAGLVDRKAILIKLEVAEKNPTQFADPELYCDMEPHPA